MKAGLDSWIINGLSRVCQECSLAFFDGAKSIEILFPTLWTPPAIIRATSSHTFVLHIHSFGQILVFPLPGHSHCTVKLAGLVLIG